MTFLLLHGIPGSAANWEPVASILREHQDVLVPGLLGLGGEPIPDVADALLAPNQARHLLQTLDRAGIDQVVVGGHDFGGPVAAHLIAAAPRRVTALALFATNAFPDTPIPFPLSTLKLPVVGAIAERVIFSRSSLAMMVRHGVGRPRLQLDVDRYVGDAHHRAAIAAIFATSLRRLRELYSPVEAALKALAVPAVVGWGDRDPFFPVAIGQRTAALIPDAQFRLYEGAGHFLPEERPAQLATDLLELAEVASGR
jgi:pimeloyl-ACP methyl ester carboxylesterase